jgi:hypothetical protein
VERDVRRQHDELPDHVDEHVADPHGEAGGGVRRVVADEVEVVLRGVAVGERLDREQQQEGRDGVDDEVDHGTGCTSSDLSWSNQ